MKNTVAQQKTTKSPKALFNLRRQRATAENLARGMKPQEAMIAAGYSPLYAQHQGYKAIKRPCIQSAFTDSCERIFLRRNIPFDRIVERYVDALDAPLMVKRTQLGDARIPKDPDTGKPYPDHAIRMEAAGHLVDLYGGKPREVEMPSAPARGLTIIIRREPTAQAPTVVNPTGLTSNVPTGTTTHSQTAGDLRETEWINLISVRR